jgi:hypothetical protein
VNVGCLLSIGSLLWMAACCTWHFLHDSFILAGWAKPVNEMQSLQSFSRGLLVGLILFLVGVLLFFAFPGR